MDFGLAPVLFIGNAYRRQMFAPFIRTKPLGKRPYLYLNSSSVLNPLGFTAFFYRNILRLAKAVVLSDAEGAKVLDQYPLLRWKTVLWFSWNSVEELKDWHLSEVKLHPNLKMCLLFSDEAKRVKEIFGIESLHFKYPVHRSRKRWAKRRYLISYVGEIDIMPRLEKEAPEINDYLWELTGRFTLTNYFDTSLIDTARARSIRINYPLFLWVLKNRMRYRYVKSLKDAYGKDFALVGNDWKKVGLDSFPTNYDARARFDLYSSSTVCIDFLSKSSSEAHYPRSAEIISYSDGIIQLATNDSEEFFGDQAAIRTFGPISDLHNKIKNLLSLSDEDLHQSGEALRKRLSSNTRDYNCRGLEL